MRRTCVLLALLVCLSGCAAVETGTGTATGAEAPPAPASAEPADAVYFRITQEEASEMMARDDGHIILDVRRQDEYDEGHIPGAVCLPNEEIGTEPPESLPDKDRTILVYCRSGRRSKEAAQKLADMGYTAVYEFGGIIEWTGEIERQSDLSPHGQDASLSFESFDGGGPEFEVTVDDPGVVSCGRSVSYAREDHDELTGAGFTVTFTFTGLKPGRTTLTVRARSPVADNFDAVYEASVDEGLNVRIVQLEFRDLMEDEVRAEEEAFFSIEANGYKFYAEPAANSSAEALKEILGRGPVVLEMTDYGDFEKVGELPWELPSNDEDITTQAGDVILYKGNRFVVYYDTNSWELTRLGKIWGVSGEELLEAFGSGDVTVTLGLEYIHVPDRLTHEGTGE